MKMTKTIVALALLFGCSATTNAQIGGLLNKAKKAAKEKVENKVKKAKNDARNKAEDAAMEKTGMKKADYDPNRKYKPSKEALAADPQANDQTIQEGFTKSIGDIHACYEQIQDVTLYSPYYTDDAKRFYGIGAEEGTFYNIFFGMFSETLKYDGIHKAYHYPNFTPVNLANDQIQVPCDEFVLNFWTCRFMADPKSEKALKEFVYAYTWLNSMNVKAIRHYAMKDETAGVIGDNAILPSNFRQMRYDRDNMAYGLAVTVTPYENLLKLANECAAGITAKDGSGFSRLLYHLVLKVLVDDFLPRHKDAKNDDSLRLLSLKLDTPRIGELLDAYQNDFVDAVSEPKGVTVDAKTRNAGIAAAKKFAGANFEKAVFTKSSWQTFKESKYPYRITTYALPIAIITKEGGKRFVQYCTLTKSANGSNYFVQAGSDTRKHPIK